MKETLLASAVFLTLFSTVSFAETSNSQIPQQDDTLPAIEVGSVGVIIKPAPYDKDQVSLGFTRQIGNITYSTTSHRLIKDPSNITHIAAFVIWKF